MTRHSPVFPGQIEYATGCPACYYKKYKIYDTKTGVFRDQWYRENVQVTEDVAQNRAGYTLSSFMTRNDCENYAQDNIHIAASLTKLQRELDAATPSAADSVAPSDSVDPTPCLETKQPAFIRHAAEKMTLDDMVPPHHFPDMSTAERIQFMQAVHNIAKQMGKVECQTITCNASSAQAGGAGPASAVAAQNLCGHATTLKTQVLHGSDKEYRSIIEGTKWVAAFMTDTPNSINRNAPLSVTHLKHVDTLSQMGGELTKDTIIKSDMDTNAARMDIKAGLCWGSTA